MQFRNFTPFIPLAFESRDEKQNDFGVLVLRASFDMENGQPLKLAEDQEPMIMADEFVDQPVTSSIVIENNIAPVKPKTDIHINAIAHAPYGEPKGEWYVRAKIGEVDKTLHVTGPRYWEKTLTKGWQLTDPLPISKLPIQYEYAFGGTHVIRSKEGEEDVSYCSENPIGVGYSEGSELKNKKTVAAPQIIAPDHRQLQLGKNYQPQGFGPIAPSWSPRLEKAGTFDDLWKKTRWPDLPNDFSFDFYNSAHPDLIYPGFLEGGETIELYHLTPEGRLFCEIPKYELAMLVRYQDGELRPAPMFLDTLHLDVEKRKAFITWRGIYPINKDIRVLEARMRILEDAVEEPEEELAETQVMAPLNSRLSKPEEEGIQHTAEHTPLGDTQVQKKMSRKDAPVEEEVGITQEMKPLKKKPVDNEEKD